jgi:hypothetical protein
MRIEDFAAKEEQHRRSGDELGAVGGKLRLLVSAV